MAHRQRIRCSREEGQILVLFALASFVLVGCMALAIDVGYLLTERREAQNAADAAALAGAVALYKGESTGAAESDAVTYALANAIDCTNCVDAAATGGQRDGVVTVEITNPVEKFFLGAVYTGSWGVSARAVAEIHDDRLGDYGLITFDPPGTKFNGNNRIRIINGSAMTNDAVNANNSNSHEFIVDGSIDSAGPINNANGGWSAPNGMNDNIPPIDDPIVAAGVIPPSPGSYAVLTQPDCDGDNCTWWPGRYQNDSALIKNATATFMPGLYYFENFDINLHNTNSRIEGTDVMFYFDDSSSFDPKNGEMYVSAPATSPYVGGKDGMVFWYANCNTIDSQGNADYHFTGVFYAPCADLVFHGNPDTPVSNGQMVVGSVEMKGTGTIDIEYNDYLDVPVFEVFLVE